MRFLQVGGGQCGGSTWCCFGFPGTASQRNVGYSVHCTVQRNVLYIGNYKETLYLSPGDERSEDKKEKISMLA